METLFKKSESAHRVEPLSKGKSKFIALVETVYLTENRPQGYDGTVASLLWSAFAKTSKTRNVWKRKTLKNLLIHLYNEKCFVVLRTPIYMDVLVHVSIFGLQVIRPLELWVRPSFSADEQLEDLIDHLFARYPTPVFLITAFYESSLVRMMWYVKLGQGCAVKRLPGFPKYFTKRMAHMFRLTPRGYDIHQALIRAEALGFGATALVADLLAYSSLRDKERNGEFWSKVISFLAKSEIDTLYDCTVVINYLEFSFGRDRGFSLKGRTFTTLLRDALAWSSYTAKVKARASQALWSSLGIAPLHLVKHREGKEVQYITVELLSPDDLFEEGEEMSNCVGDYVDDCIEGYSAIFSLRRIENGRVKRLATIDINPSTYTLAEAYGNCNIDLTHEAFSVLKTWCTETQIKGWWDRQKKDQSLPEAPIDEPTEAVQPGCYVSWLCFGVIWIICILCIRACIY